MSKPQIDFKSIISPIEGYEVKSKDNVEHKYSLKVGEDCVELETSTQDTKNIIHLEFDANEIYLDEAKMEDSFLLSFGDRVKKILGDIQTDKALVFKGNHYAG